MRQSFVRATGTVFGGTLFYNGALILSSPVLTRLYDASAFGLLGTFMALVLPGSILVTGRYELAIPIAKNDQDASNLLTLAALLAVIGSSLLAALFFLIQGLLAYMGFVISGDFVWLIFLGLLSAALSQGVIYWAIRIEAFQCIACGRILQALVMVGVQFAFVKQGAYALPAGIIAGNCAALLCIMVMLRFWFKGRWQFSGVSGLLETAHLHIKQPKFSVGSGLLNSFGRQLPVLILAIAFSTGAAGLYTLAVRVLFLPISMIGQSMSQVFYPRAERAFRVGMLSELVQTLLQVLFALALPLAALVTPFLPTLFALIFGVEWYDAGLLSVFLVPWLVIIFAVTPVSSFVIIIGAQSRELIFQVILFVARLVILILGGLYLDVMGTIISLGIVNLVCWMGFLVWILKSLGLSVKETLSRNLNPLVLAGLLFGWSLFAVSSINISMWLMVLAGAGLVIYWALSFRTCLQQIRSLG